MASINEAEEKAGIPEWVVTFGDMMSLLLTFFIMLVSMSEIKEEARYHAMAESLRRRFGHDRSMMSMIPGPTVTRNSSLDKMAVMGRARRMNTMNGGDKVKAPVGDYPKVRSIRKGEHATLGGVVDFSEGSAELTEENKRTLQTIAVQVGGKPQKIEIRGHTSTKPLPADSPYKSHWDLSYARCRNVMKFLIKIGVSPQRLRLVAAASNEPKHIRPDPLLQRENPRVEVFMLDELVQDLEGTAGEKEERFSEKQTP